ncbi:glycosyl transferase [Chthonomonas calidirosea]|uniref:glycosyltransferase n=1 Tax=Chthonomonas calidirosea TaxID=454171 RepID=UPI0006DD3C5F|nr:glycosyltransferase [Chthonomonas calidirosea]CEK17790.1 glycosyl transferase [Chthonomonas calidirosea]
MEIQRSGAKQDYLVSALVPLYNAARFLPGLIEDLEAQTLASHLEIVLCNTASPQNEQAILAEYMRRYSNIVSIYIDRRENAHEALNRCIQVASGHYLTLACADDRHRPDAIERMVQALETHPNIGLVYADSLITHGENETFANHNAHAVFRWPEYSLRQALMYAMFGPQPMWRREVHEKVGLFDPSLSIVGDYDLFLRIAHRCGAYHLPEILGLFRAGGLSMNSSDACVKETLQVLRRHRSTIPLEDIYPDLNGEWKNDAFARAAALMDYARSLLVASSVPAEIGFVESLYEEARTLIGDHPILLNNLAVLAWLKGNTKEATAAFEKLALFGIPLALQNLNVIRSAPIPQTLNLSVGTLRHPVVRVLPELLPPDRVQHSWSKASPQSLLSPEGRKADKSALSFIVITGGKRQNLIALLVQSIRKQRIPKYEVLICGNCEGLQFEGEDVILLPCPDLAAQGRLGAMRNHGIARARYETLVFLDDDCILDSEWYVHLLKGPDMFDVLTMQVRMPDGTRYWDRATKAPQRGQMILCEGEEDHAIYATGGASLMRAEVARMVRWNDHLKVGEEEDIDFSRRCRAMGYSIGHLADSLIYHADATYTSLGRWVYRRKEGRTQEWIYTVETQDPLQLYSEALARFEQGELAESIDCLRWGLLNHPENSEFRFGLSAIAFLTGGNLSNNAWYPNGWPRFSQWLAELQESTAAASPSEPAPHVEHLDRPLSPYFFASSADVKTSDPLLQTLHETREAPDALLFAWRQAGITPQLWAQPCSSQAPQYPLLEAALMKAHLIEEGAAKADLLITFAPYEEPSIEADIHIGRLQWPTLLPSSAWIAACQKLDRIWVPTSFQRERLLEVGIEAEKVGVVPLAVNCDRYRPQTKEQPQTPPLKGMRRFNFLAHFEWSRTYAWETLVRAFLQAFRPEEDVALVLHPFALQENAAQRMRQELAQCLLPMLGARHHPSIVLQTTPLESELLRALYRACHCFVSVARTADIKRSVLEAMAYSRPVIAPAWGAMQELLSEETGYPVQAIETPVNFVAALEKPWLREGRWIDIDEADLSRQMRLAFDNPTEADARGEQARLFLKQRHDYRVVASTLQQELKRLEIEKPSVVIAYPS